MSKQDAKYVEIKNEAQDENLEIKIPLGKKLDPHSQVINKIMITTEFVLKTFQHFKAFSNIELCKLYHELFELELKDEQEKGNGVLSLGSKRDDKKIKDLQDQIPVFKQYIEFIRSLCEECEAIEKGFSKIKNDYDEYSGTNTEQYTTQSFAQKITKDLLETFWHEVFNYEFISRLAYLSRVSTDALNVIVLPLGKCLDTINQEGLTSSNPRFVLYQTINELTPKNFDKTTTSFFQFMIGLPQTALGQLQVQIGDICKKTDQVNLSIIDDLDLNLFHANYKINLSKFNNIAKYFGLTLKDYQNVFNPDTLASPIQIRVLKNNDPKRTHLTPFIKSKKQKLVRFLTETPGATKDENDKDSKEVNTQLDFKDDVDDEALIPNKTNSDEDTFSEINASRETSKNSREDSLSRNDSATRITIAEEQQPLAEPSDERTLWQKIQDNRENRTSATSAFAFLTSAATVGLPIAYYGNAIIPPLLKALNVNDQDEKIINSAYIAISLLLFVILHEFVMPTLSYAGKRAAAHVVGLFREKPNWGLSPTQREKDKDEKIANEHLVEHNHTLILKENNQELQNQNKSLLKEKNGLMSILSRISTTNSNQQNAILTLTQANKGFEEHYERISTTMTH